MDFSVRTLTKKFYKKQEVKRGCADQIARVNVSSNQISVDSVGEKVKQVFTGGKGFGLWLLWNSVNEKTKWNDSENALCVASGPLGGAIGYPGAGKSTVVTLSPLTGIPIDSNVGGHFGPLLKFAGFDALAIVGKNKSKNAVIFIDGLTKKVEIMEMEGLPRYSQEISEFLTRFFGEDKPQNISVISTGPAAEKSLFGCLNFSWWDFKRKRTRMKQAGRGGTGTVMADKGIKAIVVRQDSGKMDLNPAYPELLKEVIKRHVKEIRDLDPKQNQMSIVGTTHLVEIMNVFNLLPVNNFQFGSHLDAHKLGADVFRGMFDKGFDGCWKGCVMACSHGIKDFVPKTGPFKTHKVWVDGPEYETIAALGSNLGIFDPEFVVEANFYCDVYGLDTISTGVSMAFAMECFERNLIDRIFTRRLDLRFGNKEAAMELLHQIVGGIGFGKIVGQGVKKMKEVFPKNFVYDEEQLRILNAIGMESKGLEFSLYITKQSLAQQGGYGLALKGAQHDEAWLIFEDMVRGNLPTFEDKAEALWWFPLWRTWFSLCGLCKLPWNDVIPEGNKDSPEPAKIMKHVRWYCDYFEAVTGQKTSSPDLIEMSERVYTFQRIFALRMGRGRREDDDIPWRAMGDNGEDRKEKIARYEKLKDAVYKRREWNEYGIPTLRKVMRLWRTGCQDIIALLKKQGVED